MNTWISEGKKIFSQLLWSISWELDFNCLRSPLEVTPWFLGKRKTMLHPWIYGIKVCNYIKREWHKASGVKLPKHVANFARQNFAIWTLLLLTYWGFDVWGFVLVCFFWGGDGLMFGFLFGFSWGEEVSERVEYRQRNSWNFTENSFYLFFQIKTIFSAAMVTILSFLYWVNLKMNLISSW